MYEYYGSTDVKDMKSKEALINDNRQKEYIKNISLNLKELLDNSFQAFEEMFNQEEVALSPKLLKGIGFVLIFSSIFLLTITYLVKSLSF